MSQIGLNTNLAAQRVIRRLADNSSVLRRNFERLSSGLRINRASDDAAGLSIAAGLNTDSRVYSQGVRNLNDGVGLLNVADGALEQLENVVLRLRELTTQAANGTLSFSQRKALNQEAQQLTKEYTRVVRTTRFNGQQLFDSRFGTLRLQGGYGSLGTISSGLGGTVGTGAFQTGQTLAAVNSVQEIVTGDFNNDGKSDMIAGKLNSTSVELFLGNGDGTFGSGTLITTSALRPSKLATGDFNNDGKIDLVVGHFASGNIDILLGNNDGTFQPVSTYSAGSASGGIVVGDFNGDGTQDVASVLNATGSIAMLFGNGSGGLGAAQMVNSGLSAPFSLHTGDFNGDGKLDFATTNSLTPTVAVVLGNGDGTFQTAQSFSISGLASDIQLGDFNGDNLLDIAAGTISKVDILLGNGNGTFQPATNTNGGTVVQEIDVGDFNGDGIADIVAIDGVLQSANILIGNGDGTFQSPVSYSVGAGGPTFMALGDFNGDGAHDLAVQNAANIVTLQGATASGAGPLLPFDLSYRYQALAAIPELDRALSRILLQRGTIGAFLSRIETGVNNLTQADENLRTAYSRIVDADIATEAGEMTRSQILQQASSAILAQANTLPALALALLR